MVNVIGEGKLANIAAGNGHPAEVMDLSFAVQAMSALYILEHRDEIAPASGKPAKVIDVSEEIDDIIARRRLAAWGIEIDKLTPEQEAYLNSWQL
jgi:adenosylhomocysteinase